LEPYIPTGEVVTMRWSSAQAVVTMLVLAAPPPAAAAVGFEELPPPNHMAAAVVSAINDSGQVTGSGWTPPSQFPHPGTLLAVRWDGTVPLVLGQGHGTGINRRGDVVFPLVTKQGGAQVTYVGVWENGKAVDHTPPQRTAGPMSVRDISDAGVVPLTYSRIGDPDPYSPRRAGWWRQGEFADVPLSAQGPHVHHDAVNDRGTTAGSRSPRDGSASFVFRCSGTSCTRLPAAGETGSYSVAALNESGSIAATWLVGSGSRAVVWNDDRPTVLPGDTAAVAQNTRAVNETGDVVGWRLAEGVHRATLWRGGRLVDLGTSGESEAVAVNDRGDVAGWQTIDGQPRPFHWRAGVLTGLPTPESLPAKTTAMNNAGVVVGNTLNRNTSRAFRWTVS
jgi:probable HAF family extracellular repeat protein